jgi:hypothetical protein
MRAIAKNQPSLSGGMSIKPDGTRGTMRVMSRATDILDLVPGRDALGVRVLARLHRLAAQAERDAFADEVSDFADLRTEAHRHNAVAEVIERYSRVIAEGRYTLAQIVEMADDHHRAGADAILGAARDENAIHEARFRGLAAGAKLVADVVREEARAAERAARVGALSA